MLQHQYLHQGMNQPNANNTLVKINNPLEGSKLFLHVHARILAIFHNLALRTQLENNYLANHYLQHKQIIYRMKQQL